MAWLRVLHGAGLLYIVLPPDVVGRGPIVIELQLLRQATNTTSCYAAGAFSNVVKHASVAADRNLTHI